MREAASAEEGLAALAEEPPDLILLDVEMPQVDGWEMLRLVRERHGVESIPVVMYSGKVEAGSVSEAEERGAQAFVGKPFDPEQLLSSTRQLLRSLTGLDHDLFVWVVEHRAGPLDPVFVGLGWIAYAGLVWIVLAPVVAWRVGYPMLRAVLLVIACVWASGSGHVAREDGGRARAAVRRDRRGRSADGRNRRVVISLRDMRPRARPGRSRWR